MPCKTHITEQQGLAAQEEKQKKRRKVEHEKALEWDKMDCEKCQKQWEAQSQLMERDKVQKEAYHKELCLWEAERDLAKLEKQQLGWKKPTRGELEKVVEKPKKSGVSNGNCENEGDNGSSDNSTSNGGSEV
ncbi:hypothetical protein V8B97DRAFT_1919561 [Scleroderma yunnanense]